MQTRLRSPVRAGKTAVTLGLLLLATTAACSSAYRTAVKRGNAAIESGDFVSAVKYYEEACAADEDPDNEACQAVTIHTPRAKSQMVARIRTSCGRGDVHLCGDPVNAGPKVLQADGDIVGMLNDSGREYEKRCLRQHGIEPGDLIRRVYCLRGASSSLAHSTTYNGRVVRAEDAAAAELIELATGFEEYRGAQVLLYSAAATLSADRLGKNLHASSWPLFLTESAVPLEAQLDLVAPGHREATPLCQEVAAGVHAGVRCADGGLDVTASARIGRLKTETWSARHAREYQSGTRRVPNPAYDSAVNDVDSAESALRAAEDRAAEARRKCDDIRSKLAGATDEDKIRRLRDKERNKCGRYDDLARVERDRARSYREAQNVLSSTEQYFEEPVYETYHWTSYHIRWRAPYRFAVHGLDETIRDRGTFERETMEQDAFPPAEVPAHHRAPTPTTGDVAGFVAEQAVAGTSRAIADWLMSRSSSRSADCPGQSPDWSPGWLQCRAEVLLWAGEPVDGASLVESLKAN